MTKMTYDLDWLFTNYLDFFKVYGMEESDVRNHFQKWKESRKAPTVNDYLWYIFNHLQMETAKQASNEVQLYSSLRLIDMNMAMFLKLHEKRNANHIMRSMFRNDILLNEAQSNIKLQVKIVSGACCPHCDSFNEKIMTIEEALENLPIASDICTKHLGCNCGLAYVPVRDTFGRIVRKHRV
jgi:hypothetical protein